MSKIVFGLSLLGLLFQAPIHADPVLDGESVKSIAGPVAGKFIPKDNKVLLILGQDLDSLSGYVNSDYFPAPGGVTSYLAFYRLTKSTFPAYGALGQDLDGDIIDEPVDWGAGPLSAFRASTDYPQSALVIGLNIAEGSGDNLWAAGGLADITVGAYDQNIRRLAKFFDAIKKPVYLRIGYEFDGAWNRGYEKKLSYILAFRHIVHVLREQGVNNVATVWQASASPIDDMIEGQREDIRDWYPGDDYVDWIGLSWFLPAEQTVEDTPSQRTLANEVLDFARIKNKPVMIAEAAPQGYDLESMTKANIGPLWDGAAGSGTVKKTAAEIWHEWFAPFFDYIHSHSDIIRAVAYINADWDAQALWAPPYAQGYWGDTRVQVNPEIRSKWLTEMSDTRFWLHGDEALLSNIRH